MSWDGNINSPHTMQDEYELQRELGAETLTTDDDGQMIAADDTMQDFYDDGGQA